MLLWYCLIAGNDANVAGVAGWGGDGDTIVETDADLCIYGDVYAFLGFDEELFSVDRVGEGGVGCVVDFYIV